MKEKEIKQELFSQCQYFVSERLNRIQQTLSNIQDSLANETKSSAGDKHETGRAMLQLEMEKLGQQYQTVLSQKDTLRKIDISLKNKVQIGSLVFANGFYYFLATSIGQVKIQNTIIMVLSINSPIGTLLLGKNRDDSFVFNGKTVKIESVF